MTLLLFTAGFALAALLGVYLPGAGWLLPAGAAGGILGVALLVLGRPERLRRLGRFGLVVLGGAAALLWLHAYTQIFLTPAQAMENRTLRLEAAAADWPEETDYGARLTVLARESGGEGRRVKAVFYGDRELLTLRPGDRLSCVARCTPAEQGELSLYNTSKGILLRCKGYGDISVQRAEKIPPRYALRFLAQEMRERIDGLYPPGQAGFLRALLTGDRSRLDEVDQDNFRRVGLSHVVVISGLHVSFLLGFLSLFLKPERRGRLLLLLLLLTAFTLMTGSAPGTVRSAILGGLTLVGRRIRRETHPMVSLSAGLLFLLALNPYAIANAGLQFSFLSTAGIFVFGQPWSRAWGKRVPKRWKRAAGPFAGTAAVSLGTMLFTLPLSALYFGEFSLIAPLSNLLTAWAVSLAFLGGLISVAAGAVFLPLGQMLAKAVGLPVQFFLWYSAKASRLTLAALGTASVYYTLWALLAYGVVLLYLLFPGKARRRVLLPLCLCLLTLGLAAQLNSRALRRWDLGMTVLDVGQGQSIALWSDHTWAMVDCGGSYRPGDTAAGYLQAMGCHGLDLLVLTHYDADHAGGVSELMGRLEVAQLALPDTDPEDPLRQEIEALAAERGIPVHYITQAQRTAFGKGELTLFPPLGEGASDNEKSLCILARSGDWEALITGDLPAQGEEALLRRETLPDIEVLVAGHHGSKYSTGEALLEAVRPETAVISVGRNSYGHPAPETLERLAQAQVQVLRTDRQGNITLYATHQEAD